MSDTENKFILHLFGYEWIAVKEEGGLYQPANQLK